MAEILANIGNAFWYWYWIDTQNNPLELERGKCVSYKDLDKGSNTSLVVPEALAHRLQRRTARFVQNGQWGLEIHKFFDSIIPSMRISKIQNGRQSLESGLPLGL